MEAEERDTLCCPQWYSSPLGLGSHASYQSYAKPVAGPCQMSCWVTRQSLPPKRCAPRGKCDFSSRRFFFFLLLLPAQHLLGPTVLLVFQQDPWLRLLPEVLGTAAWMGEAYELGDVNTGSSVGWLTCISR